eukprot:COSAG01_NODE_57974_length_309_cov_0.538095_1_plen_30_part_01
MDWRCCVPCPPRLLHPALSALRSGVATRKV